jgi:hypothetical protein
LISLNSNGTHPNQIDEWHSTKAAFIISRNSLHQLYTLRKALREKPELEGKYSSEQLKKIWSAKGAFRAALRADIQLLFREEGEDSHENSNG